MTTNGLAADSQENELRTASFSDDSTQRHPSDDFEYGTLFGTSFNILIIDDEVLVARMLSRVLKKYATRVYMAATPAEARSILRNHSVNFVVCDFNLGEAAPSGVELIENLRGEFSGIERAVIFSGEDSGSIPPSPATDQVLHKTRDLEQLCALIRRSANAHRVFEM